MRKNEFAHAVTKLRNQIYVLCRSVIHVFEDRNTFCLQKEIDITKVRFPVDMDSSEKNGCLYVSDDAETLTCVWKVTRDTDDAQTVIKWLETDFPARALSVSSGDQLLIVNGPASSLMIYGSEAELIRSINLPREIAKPIHAVETSIGNLMILYRCDERVSGSQGKRKWAVSELTRDGQMVICRFIPSEETQELYHPEYLSLDSDDRVFIADQWNHRVILLDSDLKWNRILCPTKEETNIPYPLRLCYDEENKQLLVECDS